MCERCETQVRTYVGATCPDKKAFDTQLFNSSYCLCSVNFTHTHTHTQTFNDLHSTSNTSLPNSTKTMSAHIRLCVCACAESIFTHVQWPAEGVLLHTAPLCILTLQRQVLVQETIELLQSWQPPHQRHTETEEGSVIVRAKEAEMRLSRPILSP